ncbi:hypothetical protein BZG36_00980 [Bifiguratus adelaidae]|uniref:UBC core domain-containing protein n=1 Tax=Bifiguratus adelaidae TaxID=1938954 RepID=A0A261Y633_9FUNG|nr:hypothetical protein BZG36_00980 [Bifiguratus adelaidae]
MSRKEHVKDLQSRHAQDILKRPLSDAYWLYELKIELAGLQRPNQCPLGVYILPSVDKPRVWYGTIFIDAGFYSNGVFKSRILVPPAYPYQTPQIQFSTEMFHPLVDRQGYLNTLQRFPTWHPERNRIKQLLFYLRDIFEESTLDGIAPQASKNDDAYRVYRKDRGVFGKLAQQCALLSIEESIILENGPDDNLLRFGAANGSSLKEIKKKFYAYRS